MQTRLTYNRWTIFYLPHTGFSPKVTNNNRQLINSLKQINPMSAAENVLSMRNISHRAN